VKRVISTTKCSTTLIISTNTYSHISPLQFIVQSCLCLRLYIVDVTMNDELYSLAMKWQWLNRAIYGIILEKLRKTMTLLAQIRNRHLRKRRFFCDCTAHSNIFGLHRHFTNLKRKTKLQQLNVKENLLVISNDLIFCRRNNLAISPLKNKDKVHKETQ
jgi:hypothetical protein